MMNRLFGRSIYNFIAITSTGKKYLLKVQDYSAFSHTGEFLSSEIEKVPYSSENKHPFLL